MSRSETLLNSAQKHILGGVNSPVRAFKSVGGTPLFFKHTGGAHVLNEDGKRYVDYIGSRGPMILSHGHPDVLNAMHRQLNYGLSCGAPTVLEVEVADLVRSAVPSMETVRMVSSGAEVTMSATHLVRGYAGRDNVIRFEDCYHSHSDSLLAKAGSGAPAFDAPSSSGVPAALTKHTLILPFNGIKAVHKILGKIGREIACIIVEPVAGSMGCAPSAPGLPEGPYEACDEHGMVLIFGKVMTGFRVALGGAQAYYGVTPGLSTFDKIIDGGIPVGAFGGKHEIMQQISPLGPVYRAGTLSGNPLAIATELTTLCLISRPGFHGELAAYTTRMPDGLQQHAGATGIPSVTTQTGGIFGLYFSGANAAVAFENVMANDVEGFKCLFHLMLDDGVYLTLSVFKAGLTSIAYSGKKLEITLNAAGKAFVALKWLLSRRSSQAPPSTLSERLPSRNS